MKNRLLPVAVFAVSILSCFVCSAAILPSSLQAGVFRDILAEAGVVGGGPVYPPVIDVRTVVYDYRIFYYDPWYREPCPSSTVVIDYGWYHRRDRRLRRPGCFMPAGFRYCRRRIGTCRDDCGTFRHRRAEAPRGAAGPAHTGGRWRTGGVVVRTVSVSGGRQRRGSTSGGMVHVRSAPSTRSGYGRAHPRRSSAAPRDDYGASAGWSGGGRYENSGPGRSGTRHSVPGVVSVRPGRVAGLGGAGRGGRRSSRY